MDQEIMWIRLFNYLYLFIFIYLFKQSTKTIKIDAKKGWN